MITVLILLDTGPKAIRAKFSLVLILPCYWGTNISEYFTWQSWILRFSILVGGKRNWPCVNSEDCSTCFFPVVHFPPWAVSSYVYANQHSAWHSRSSGLSSPALWRCLLHGALSCGCSHLAYPHFNSVSPLRKTTSFIFAFSQSSLSALLIVPGLETSISCISLWF